MYKVSLNDLVFYANHGLYTQETLSGNRFIVNISVWYKPSSQVNEKINLTVDYEVLAKIIQQRMSLASNLLESIAEDIIKEVKTAFPFAEKTEISIQKENPPLGLNCRSSEVSILKEY